MPNIIRYYNGNAEKRLSVQKRLFVGMSKWWWQHGKHSEEFIRVRGTLDMAPWVALAGLRLPGSRIKPIIGWQDSELSLSILLEILRMPSPSSIDGADWKAEGRFWAKGALLGDLLDRCYQRKILSQPDEDDIKSRRRHTNLTINAIDLINIWGNMYASALPADMHRSLRLSDILDTALDHFDFGPPFEESTAESFRSLELCLSTIRRVGRLDVKWTPYLDRHLDFDINSSTLSLFWFGFVLKAAPIFQWVIL